MFSKHSFQTSMCRWINIYIPVNSGWVCDMTNLYVQIYQCYIPVNFRMSLWHHRALCVDISMFIYLWNSGWVCDITNLYVQIYQCLYTCEFQDEFVTSHTSLCRCINIYIPVNFRMSLWHHKPLCADISMFIYLWISGWVCDITYLFV